MTTMLERAARAAYGELARQNDEAGELLFIGDGALLARAVLVAVREPDEALTFSAGWFSCDYSSEFTAMVDAILNEGAKL